MFTVNEVSRLFRGQDWGIAQAECQARPRLAGKWIETDAFSGNFSSALPLHLACSLRPPEGIIQTLVVSYPQGVKSKETAYGRLPIHVACRYGASFEVIQALLLYHPDGAKEPDDMGRIPLHYAISNQAHLSVIELLLETFEDSVKVADIRGWLPVHAAVTRGSPEVVRLLVEIWPESLFKETNKGTTPVLGAKSLPNNSRKREILPFLEGEMDPFSDLVEDHAQKRNSGFDRLRSSVSV
eukprot:CAMPEP_0197435746 /NCGR_PEP_ID=MMETSP1175-20131217/3281_1 /TAXON_ID=1003142 /ORGANISM="Triceratium dubium, Strain CCMP147" /LENGTH=239 /DNA_ID=CAMNT_0042964855 /DNA_START=239 /DNA_END=958 /DNA_ORIENTATION=+